MKRVRAKKQLGQHFLTDQSIAIETVEAFNKNQYSGDAFIVGWEDGRYGDYWTSSKFAHDDEDFDKDGFIWFDGIKCYAKGPGSHPGGNQWWYEPVDPVFVPIWKIDDEDDA